MNWENSKAITALKHDFLVAFFKQDKQFFLTGGSALGIFYLEHRLSYDLDLFTCEESVDWHLLNTTIIATAKSIGADCRQISASPHFYRYALQRRDENEIVDFVIELVPQLDAEKVPYGQIRVDTIREILVNKICALVGRCEVKDVLDLYFLQKAGHDILSHIEEARQKEAGVEPAMLSFLLDQIQIQEIPEYVLLPVTTDELLGFMDDLRSKLADLSYPANE